MKIWHKSEFRLWKLVRVFEYFKKSYSALYCPTENLTEDEVIMIFKGRVLFQQTSEKKRRFIRKLYELCDVTGYREDLTIYLGIQLASTGADIILEHGTVLQLKRKVEGVGSRLFVDIYFHNLKSFWIYTIRK
jgi:hypothetical protein